MQLRPLIVRCYAGSKADESPRRFKLGTHWIEVRAIIDRWYQGAHDPEWPIADYFRVTDDQGTVYLLRHDREADAWYLVDRCSAQRSTLPAKGLHSGRQTRTASHPS